MTDHGNLILTDEQSQIKAIADEREIIRLCHFTRLESLSRIIESGGLMSRAKLDNDVRPCDPNDKLRNDKFLDHISLSVTVPNLALMTKFEDQYPDVDWIILVVDVSRLWSDETLFCPTNAATLSGAHCHPGATTFENLFAWEVQTAKGSWCRYGDHRKDCPTYVQAEVLVKSSISLKHVAGIFVNSVGAYEEVQSILAETRPPLEIPIQEAHSFFCKDTVYAWMKNPSAPRLEWVLLNDELNQ